MVYVGGGFNNSMRAGTRPLANPGGMMDKDWLIAWEEEHGGDPEYEDMTEDELCQAAEDAHADHFASMMDAAKDRRKYGDE